MSGSFAAAINCIDGRAQEPVRKWMTDPDNGLTVDFIDMITEPGADKVLSLGPSQTVEALRRKLQVSRDAHQTNAAALVGHYQCAANPVPREEHIRQITSGVDFIASWGLVEKVIGLWVNESWEVEKVYERP